MTTFCDPVAEGHYLRSGYAVVDLLGPEALTEAISVAEGLVRTTPGVFQATLYDQDRTYRRAVDASLRPLFARALEAHLVDQRIFVANLLVKPPGPGTELGVHQDWTFVDEPAFTSATVWCPLIDVDEHNGTLVLLERSHLLGPTWRGSPKVPSPFDGLEQVIAEDHGTPVTCRAGQAVVYDHRLVHWSGPNATDAERLAVGVGIAPRSAPLRHIHIAADGEAHRYTVPDDFLLDLEFGSPPATFSAKEAMVVPERSLTAEELGDPEPAPASTVRRRARWFRR